MGSNTPQKFSAAKLFGFGGGDNKKVSEPALPPPQPSKEMPSNFSNSFSTQAIKMETRFDSFKGLPSSSAGLKNYDDEPVRGAGHSWNVDNQETVDDVEVFSDSDEGEQSNNNNMTSNVLGFHDDF